MIEFFNMMEIICQCQMNIPPMNINQIISSAKLESTNIVNVYVYGSHVYGTATEKSDYDYTVIVKKSNETQKQIKLQNADITIYPIDYFQSQLQEYLIEFVECVSLEYNPKLTDNFILIHNEIIKMPLKLNLSKLREGFSRKSSLSWVRAKKKFVLNGEDIYIGRKSLFHSLRILLFGIQVVKKGYIFDFTEGREYYDDIVRSEVPNGTVCQSKLTREELWKVYSKKYKPIYNKLHSEFKKMTPKK